MTLKIKRIRIVRPEVQVEFKRPILGRFYFLFMLPKLFVVKKAKINVLFDSKLLPEYAGYVKIIKMWFVGIPKIKVGGACD